MDTSMVKLGDVEAKEQEILSLQKKVSELESQLGEAQKLIQKHLLEANEVDLLKMKSSDTLTKAKSVIFENTKMIKNQELQIGALNQQVEALRDVVKITKDLLDIRNLEVDQLESKIKCMEEKYKAEKERQDLMHQRLEQMIRHNGELKREYEAQLCLFQALRERYDERELAKGVVDALKADIKVDKEKQCGQTLMKSEPSKQNVDLAGETEDKKIEKTESNEKKIAQNETQAEPETEQTPNQTSETEQKAEQNKEEEVQQNTSTTDNTKMVSKIDLLATEVSKTEILVPVNEEKITSNMSEKVEQTVAASDSKVLNGESLPDPNASCDLVKQ